MCTWLWNKPVRDNIFDSWREANTYSDTIAKAGERV